MFQVSFFLAQAILAPLDVHYFSGEPIECELFFGIDPCCVEVYDFPVELGDPEPSSDEGEN